MTAEEILARLRHEPFEPFRLCMTDGSSYDIRHQAQCIVTTTSLHIGIPHPTECYMQRIEVRPLRQLRAIERLETVAHS